MAVDHATDIRRTITGLVLAAIVVLALVLRGWVLLALILLVAALGHVFTDVPTAQVPAFSRKLLQAAQVSLSDVCSRMDKTGKMTPDDRAVILNFAKQFAADNAPAE